MNTRNQSRQASGHPSASRNARPSPPDVRQVITDRIIALLEQGVPAFRQRWTRAASRGLPRNGLTGAPYHGANVLVLWDAAIECGYASHVWLTYKQAERLGAELRVARVRQAVAEDVEAAERRRFRRRSSRKRKRWATTTSRSSTSCAARSARSGTPGRRRAPMKRCAIGNTSSPTRRGASESAAIPPASTSGPVRSGVRL